MLLRLYTLLYTLLLPLLFARLWWRGRANPAYRQRWLERLAYYQTQRLLNGAVVFHVVSVGEVHAALPLIEGFMQRHPHVTVLVTTTTPTGSERVRELFGQRVQHCYLPYDVPGCVQRFFRHFKPHLLVLMETELWPNLIAHCAQQACPVLLVNARLSAKSQGSYQRVARLTAQMLQHIHAVAAQAPADGERLQQLGLPASRLTITGSLKFDVLVNNAKVAQARRVKSQWQGRDVMIAASTREGEDALVLQAFTAMLPTLPTLLLVLVPRHVERFASSLMLARSQGLHAVSQTSGETVTSATQVLVGDTLGDMHYYYSLADVAFIGGSLVNTGCQNIIEAAALGLPIVTGPSLYNFQAASEVLQEAGAMQVVADPPALAQAVVALFNNPGERLQRAARASAAVAANVGATARTLVLIESYLQQHE